ncbi:MAG TPA: hypothetical protein VN317_10810 [Candidatus Methanoperedens sp.]|nr:hypothetical protein [Candidatus Methanoperedens sp.]
MARNAASDASVSRKSRSASERFEQVYPERYEDRCGFFRPVIRETAYKHLGCGDRVRSPGDPPEKM